MGASDRQTDTEKQTMERNSTYLKAKFGQAKKNMLLTHECKFLCVWMAEGEREGSVNV